MRKAQLLLLLLLSCVGLLPCYAAPEDGGIIKFPIPTMGQGTVGGPRPHMPPHIPYDTDSWVYVSYDPVSASLDVTSTDSLGEIVIFLQNLTTGENYCYPSYGALNRISPLGSALTIPFMGGEGIWKISLLSLSRHKTCFICEGLFFVENGFIREY